MKSEWTYERCREAALKCKSRSEFKEKVNAAYRISRKNKWLDDICSHMKELKKPENYWNYETCKEVALKCKSKQELRKKYSSAYMKILSNKWLELILHMKEIIKPKGHWNYENCKEIALKCKSKKELKKIASRAYHISRENKWLDDICSHMKLNTKPMYYWNYERCKETALKCKSRSELLKNYPSCYHVAIRKKWLDDICSHMKKIGNKYYRCIYAFEFSDNSVYIGLTCDISRRENQHLNDITSTVYKYIQKNNLQPKLKQLTDYIDRNSASIKEGKCVEEYIKNGWSILNKMPTGGLGGNTLIWTREKAHEAALKCESRNEFNKKYHGAYEFARSRDWLDEMCSHMKELKKPKGYWTKEKSYEVYLKYDSHSQLRKHKSHILDKRWFLYDLLFSILI